MILSIVQLPFFECTLVALHFFVLHGKNDYNILLIGIILVSCCGYQSCVIGVSVIGVKEMKGLAVKGDQSLPSFVPFG